MESQKILNLLNEASHSKIVTKKWTFANDQGNTNYAAGNETFYKTDVLMSVLCDYNDAYILVRGDTTINGHNQATQVAFRNCALFTKCIKKIDEKTIDDAEDLDLAAEDLDLAMLMCSLIKHIRIILTLQLLQGFTPKIKHIILILIFEV